MPCAARADSEYFASTDSGGSRISVSDGSKDEHTPPTLRHSEETRVDNPPRHAIPELGQRLKNDSEVPTAVAREEAGYVLKENPSGSNSPDDSGELEEQAASFPGESCALTGDGQVLAGESSAEEVNGSELVKTHGYPWPGLPPPVVNCGAISDTRSSPRWFSEKESANIVIDGHPRETGAQHVTPVRIRLAKEHMLEAHTGQPRIHPADAAEQRPDPHAASGARRSSSAHGFGPSCS